MSARTVTSKQFADLTAAELYALLRLRCEVFVVEQDCAYLDLDGRDHEPTTVHHWISAPGQPQRLEAYLRTLQEPDQATRIGRVVTAAPARHRGLAARLLDHVAAATTGPIVLDAQAHLEAWYRSRGYVVDGDLFLEDGIPHLPMRLTRRR